MRGRGFIGTYMRERMRIGNYRLLWNGKHYGKQNPRANFAIESVERRFAFCVGPAHV